MGLVDGKRALVTGVANRGSIAWGIARALHEEGARIGLSYAAPSLERRVRPLAEQVGAELVEECDVTDDDALDRLFARVGESFGTLDVLVHAIAGAALEELAGRFSETSRAGFHAALDVSTYSLLALARRAAPLMPPGASIVTLTAIGSSSVLPHYNVMGVAKAALEASVRYLADDLGPQGIRVNALSPGAVKTLAASSLPGFRDAYRRTAGLTPLRTNVTQDDVGRAALWLCSDWARAVTGEIVYVDAGYHILGATTGDLGDPSTPAT
jgi:enoyl-[acyl-carrier protein] reductase I